MHEHQIVITLKPEEFQLVEKAAREAGAGSVSIFLRGQLLAALGIEGDGASVSELDLQPLVTELRRLHQDLKEFVTESLVTYAAAPSSSESAPDAPPGMPFVAENPLPAAAPARSPELSPKQAVSEQPAPANMQAQPERVEKADLPPSEPVETKSEKTEEIQADLSSDDSAERAFFRNRAQPGVSSYYRWAGRGVVKSSWAAYSAGASAGESSAHQPAKEMNALAEEKAPLPEPDRAAAAPGAAGVKDESVGKSVRAAGKGEPSGRQKENAYKTNAKYTKNIPAPEPKPSLDEKAKTAASDLGATPEADRGSAPLILPPDVTMTIPAMSADDFLKSAQSLLSASQEGRDPLSELLGVEPAGKEASASSPVDDDDDTYDVPLSILARRQQLKEQSRGEESKPDSSQSKASKDKNADPPAVAVPPDKPDKPESGTRKNEQKRNVPPPAKQLKTSGSQGNSGFLADRSPLENRDEDSPFSGGPPPKRRQ